MIKQYLLENRSWITLFISLQILFLFIGFIDSAIPFKSILYIVFLSFIIFFVFLIIRYHKETSFYKQIHNMDNMYDLAELDRGSSPFERIVYESVVRQAEYYRKEIGQYKSEQEQEQDELLSWIHEVKTPLTTIKLMIERIDDRLLKEQLKVEWLRIDLLLDQQLHQKRIPFIEKNVYIGKVALQPLLYGEIKRLQSWCLHKGIGFDISLKVEQVLTDEKWLGFIIRQLLTNAIKYSDQSDISIKSISADNQTKLIITDHGRGIDSKDISRIFDKGFTSTANHGDAAATGMGLYLAQKVAETLFIQIDVQSVRHAGTTFTLRFPKKNNFVHIASM